MQRKPFIVALTGGIASGKSEASRFFADQAIQIIDADKIAHDLFAENSVYLKDLKRLFGSSIFHSHGKQLDQLNRQALASIVFKDPQKLDQLNQLSHPLIFKQIKQSARRVTSPYTVIDIPLLVDLKGHISSHYRQLIDRILVIEASPEIQLKRLAQRDGLNQDEAKLRLKAQSSNEQRRLVADDLIINNQSMKHLNQCLNDLHHCYLELTNKD